MKRFVVLATAALLAGSAAHAQTAKPTPKYGSVPSDGRGNSVANQQQQIQADEFQMRQDKANKDTKKYKKHQRQMQQDQEKLQNSTNNR